MRLSVVDAFAVSDELKLEAFAMAIEEFPSIEPATKPVALREPTTKTCVTCKIGHFCHQYWVTEDSLLYTLR